MRAGFAFEYMSRLLARSLTVQKRLATQNTVNVPGLITSVRPATSRPREVRESFLGFLKERSELYRPRSGRPSKKRTTYKRKGSMDRLESEQHLRTESIWVGGGGRVCVCVGGGGRGANRGVMVIWVTSRTGVMLMAYLIRTDTKETIETVRINRVFILRTLELKIVYVI